MSIVYVCEELSGAEWKIRSIKKENKDLQESVTSLQFNLGDMELRSHMVLLLSKEHTSVLKTRKLELEN